MGSLEVANTAVDTDANGDFTVNLDEFRRLESKAGVTAQAEGGFAANVRSISGRTVTIRLFDSGGTAGADFAAVTSEVNVTAVNILARGY